MRLFEWISSIGIFQFGCVLVESIRRPNNISLQGRYAKRYMRKFIWEYLIRDPCENLTHATGQANAQNLMGGVRFAPY